VSGMANVTSSYYAGLNRARGLGFGITGAHNSNFE
jgi:hypothetical protein